jgi:DNA repair protein SbcD/Mre11
MRILHTSDWHVGRKLGRHDRTQEMRAALEEIATIADERAVDLVLVSGDVFDRPVPPVDALSIGLGGLLRLAEGRPVVAVAGNHDAPELFDALAPFLRERGVHVRGAIRRPEEGGVIGADELGVPAAVACFPFLREGRVVDFMRDTGRWYGQYAEKVAAICAAYSEALAREAGAGVVPILVAHFMVTGVRLARSERELHIGEAYSATAQAIPPGPQYVALGHIHAPQDVPGAPVPARYAGSALALDFGEAGEEKRVVIVDAEPGHLATIESVPLVSGRALRRETGTWDELAAREEELRDAFLELSVRTGGPDPELGRRAAELYPYLVRVRALHPDARDARDAFEEGERPDDLALFAAYHEATYGDAPPAELTALLREVLEEAADAPT